MPVVSAMGHVRYGPHAAQSGVCLQVPRQRHKVRTLALRVSWQHLDRVSDSVGSAPGQGRSPLDTPGFFSPPSHDLHCGCQDWRGRSSRGRSSMCSFSHGLANVRNGSKADIRRIDRTYCRGATQHPLSADGLRLRKSHEPSRVSGCDRYAGSRMTVVSTSSVKRRP